MPDYRRLYQKGGTYFFVVATYLRQPFLTQPAAREIFHNTITAVQKKHPFRMDAICLLPDHLHCIWTLPDTDDNFSVRWSEIKRQFTHQYRSTLKYEVTRNKSREDRDERSIWQRRFWEHLIRDDKDYETHLNYIHYNPVKHGYVTRPADWEWSSFHRFVRDGAYPPDWSDQGKEYTIKIDKEYE
jgi:putative transposase